MVDFFAWGYYPHLCLIEDTTWPRYDDRIEEFIPEILKGEPVQSAYFPVPRLTTTNWKKDFGSNHLNTATYFLHSKVHPNSKEASLGMVPFLQATPSRRVDRFWDNYVGFFIVKHRYWYRRNFKLAQWNISDNISQLFFF